MYNAEQKLRYINECGFTGEKLQKHISIFESISPIEEELGMDVCEMDADGIQRVTSRVIGVRSQSLARISYLRSYIRWCVRQGIPGATLCFESVRPSNVERIGQVAIANPLRLQIYLDAVFKPENILGIDNTYRAIFWLAYAGVKQDDVWEIRKQNINLDDMTVEFDERSFPIYREGIRAIRNCVELDYFVRNHPRTGKPTQYKRVESDFLLRGVRTNPIRSTIMRIIERQVSDAKKSGRVDIKLSYTNTLFSGRMYRQYEMEQAGMPPDFWSDVLYDTEDSRSANIDKERVRLVRCYKQDYENWKQLYH